MELASVEVDEETAENTKKVLLTETVGTICCEESANFVRENGSLELSDVFVEEGEIENVLKEEESDEVKESYNRVDEERCPRSSGNRNVLETAVCINSEGVNGGNEDSDALGKIFEEEGSCVVDVKSDGVVNLDDKQDSDVVCRICHLSAQQSPKAADAASVADSITKMDLINLGCECKDELGTAHGHCAETWFKLKGNRLCEICGETAKNVRGIGNSRFIEEWNERRFTINSSRSERRRCWQGQSFCNFLMAFLVIAFVLPWFFRVNMF